MVYRQLFVYYFIPRLGTSFITQCHVKSIIFSVVANLPVLGLLPLLLFYWQIIVIAELEMEG